MLYEFFNLKQVLSFKDAKLVRVHLLVFFKAFSLGLSVPPSRQLMDVQQAVPGRWGWYEGPQAFEEKHFLLKLFHFS